MYLKRGNCIFLKMLDDTRMRDAYVVSYFDRKTSSRKNIINLVFLSVGLCKLFRLFQMSLSKSHSRYGDVLFWLKPYNLSFPNYYIITIVPYLKTSRLHPKCRNTVIMSCGNTHVVFIYIFKIAVECIFLWKHCFLIFVFSVVVWRCNFFNKMLSHDKQQLAN